ncbi:hypothetical protein ACWEBX_37550 [Streptomyces sp. NPDC005070]
MTTFILVAGARSGGWIWREVAAGLRESGARAHPVALSGHRRDLVDAKELGEEFGLSVGRINSLRRQPRADHHHGVAEAGLALLGLAAGLAPDATGP